MMRWPWTNPDGDPLDPEQRAQVERVAAKRREALRLIEQAERTAAELQALLDRRDGTARGRA